MDGIMSEHLKYTMDSHFVFNISVLLSLCLIGGSVPDGFCQTCFDDLLVCSLSVTGLQKLIDTASFHVEQHGL